jgi:hypothetical protein
MVNKSLIRTALTFRVPHLCSRQLALLARRAGTSREHTYPLEGE